MPSPNYYSPDSFSPDYFSELPTTVATALREDISSGDLTACLVPATNTATARVICREAAVICGRPWVDEVFKQIDSSLTVEWKIAEGDSAQPDSVIFTVSGNARALLTAERSALNFLQTLSAVATTARHYAELVKHTAVQILDTRKTIPGLRLAQKYAVKCGGCHNHRIGLYDAYLIKENHIAACGSIGNAVTKARELNAERKVEVEVETLAELNAALQAKADIIMLDNFSVELIREAVRITKGLAKLEASGGFNEHMLVTVAETGVDYISVGALTKHVRAIDFSMLFSR
jgi:nicotinate-nucleotide pyrophosphorylase (carboxylating)